MPSHAAAVIAYLRDCLEADRSAQAIWSLLSSSVESPHVLGRFDELIDGSLDRLPVVDGAWAEGVSQVLRVYQREKALVLGILPVVGRPGLAALPVKTLCAPVVFWPAHLEQEPLAGRTVHFLGVEMEEAKVNVPVLKALGAGDEAPDALAAVLDELPLPPYDLVAIGTIRRVLSELLPEVDCSALGHYPRHTGEDDLLAAMRRKRAAVLPAAVAAIVRNPPMTQGVLFELSALAASAERAEALSPPLHTLLGDEGAPTAKPAGQPGRVVPADLSEPQQAALHSAAGQRTTLLVGPPGTGKSYTLAAAAVDHLVRGEGVLLATRTQTALDVVADKLEQLLGDTAFVVRGTGGKQQARVKAFLRRCLDGVLPFPEAEAWSRGALEAELDRLLARIADHERHFRERTALELKRGALDAAAPDGLVHDLFRALHQDLLDWRLRGEVVHWERLEALQALWNDAIALKRRLAQVLVRERLGRVLQDDRQPIRRLLDAISARTSSRRAERFGQLDLRVVLSVLPVWLTDFGGIHRLFPLQQAAFDVALIDEATQCDPASALPVLQRAKRAVVTGDPRQLRHVSFLSRAMQRTLARRHALDEAVRLDYDYRERSLLDLVDASAGAADQVVFLDEHFRSRPHIIAFSNHAFYDDRLRIMTARPGRASQPAVELQRVDGRRTEDGANPAEARALIDELQRILDHPRDGAPPTIGVLSPFRAQVEHLQAALGETLSSVDIEACDLLVATAYGFQGHERDVMLLSLAADPDLPGAALRYLERADVFNVAVTRARDRQVVFASLDPCDLAPGSLLRRYLEYVTEPPSAARPHPTEDSFAREVAARFEAEGFTAWPAFEVAGITVDLVLEKDGRALGLDLIGHPGAFADALPLSRTRMLYRAGLPTVPLPLSAWQQRPRGCVAAIVERWGRV